ncbi:uncharacterized protein PHACADRAFT_188557 [Phanerochaete carnosa HHB-10118-sp]|uniref:Uncharacterized protein n=1 Tax=Phanerochaete carnosa (strain HHB-10118-sp) TaxID=650164 RepID=K5UKV9_PHACS|nr:uncharacterized protein PHACADRAFT_188557 [Phanerochaete carnosa HHB-10118-sp]EKM50281.1 hypothetical protein PHACADRAFT_188557 [Phanerochaete carnosa HHB-10118-sp]
MPPSRKAQISKHLEDLREKDKQIVELESRLEAQAAKSSLLQERLAATLDAMDALQQTYESELSAERQAKEKAREKLQRFMEYASSIERERDECREALLAVVEKVEEYADLLTWHNSLIRAPSLLEPIELSRGLAEPDVEADPKLIVATLRAELERERVSHERTHKHVEEEILSLRVRLTRCEAELEACAVHQDHAVLLASSAGADMAQISPSQKVEANVESGPALSPKAAFEVLELRAAGNKALEMEFMNLSAKFQHVRQASGPVRTVATPTIHNPLKSPDLRPCSPDDVLSPYTMTPRHPSTPRAGKSASHLRLSHAAEATDSPAKIVSTEMEKFEEEVWVLAEGVDNFEEQRRLTRKSIEDNSLGSAVASSSTAPRNVGYDTSSSQNTAVQGAPSPPKADEADVTAALRIELEQVRIKAARREAELLEEITRLQEALSSIPQSSTPAIGDFLDDDGVEQPLYLAMPLAPTTVLWGSGDKEIITITNQAMEAQMRTALGTATEPETDAEDQVIDDSQSAETSAAGVQPREGALSPLFTRPDADTAIDEDEDMSLRVPLPPSPDDSGEAFVRSQSNALRHRPPTPYASPDVSLMDAGATADESDGESALLLAAKGWDCTCVERLDILEREVEETKQTVAQRDEEIVELRRQVHELRMVALGR